MKKEVQKEAEQIVGDRVHLPTATQVIEIKNLASKRITISETKSKKETEKLALFFNPVKNKFDGRVAEIPNNTIGKIYGHQGYDITQIIEHIPTLFETSMLGWSEPEIQREGKKYHPNIKEYHHYINKFFDGICEYFIRFTLSEEKAKSGKIGKNKIHSTAISCTSVYKNGDGSQRIRGIDPGETSSSPFLDLRLAEFFNFVKQD